MSVHASRNMQGMQLLHPKVCMQDVLEGVLILVLTKAGRVQRDSTSVVES